MDQYYESLLICAKRYSTMLMKAIDDNNYWGWRDVGYSTTKAASLVDFLVEFQRGIQDNLPLNKLNRWLGYIQGTLIAWDITSVQAERDFTRPLFRPFDFPED